MHSNLAPVFSSAYSGNGIQNHDPTEDLTPPVEQPTLDVPTGISVTSICHELILIVYQVKNAEM